MAEPKIDRPALSNSPQHHHHHCHGDQHQHQPTPTNTNTNTNTNQHQHVQVMPSCDEAKLRAFAADYLASIKQLRETTPEAPDLVSQLGAHNCPPFAKQLASSP
jgi:hypothetical protein